MARPRDDDAEDARSLQRHLEVEANFALRRGALVAVCVALVGAVPIPFMMAAGLSNMLVPLVFALLAGAMSTEIWLLARRGLVRGRVAYFVLVPFASLPTFMFLISHFVLGTDGAAGSFMTGPFSYVYLVTFAVAGFLFDFRLTATSAIVASAGYLACYALGRPSFQAVHAANPVLQQDLSSDGIWVIKALMIAFGGITIGALGTVARRLVVRMVAEEREKSQISRLFGQYVSEEVKERILRDPLAQAGERKQVVVLFSDIRAFTSYSETAEPEEIVRRLNTYFDAMVGAIHAHGGVIDKFIGDAVMATFGGLVAVDNPAAAAFAAARDMRHRLRALNASWPSPWEMGIGLHLGDVVLGAIGSADRKDFTVIGDCVNTASRVEGLTKTHGHPILVTGELHARLPAESQAMCTLVGDVPIHGRRAPLTIYGVPDGDGLR